MASAAIRAGPLGRKGRPATISGAAGSGFFPPRTAKKMPITTRATSTMPPARKGASFFPSMRCWFVAAEAAVPGHAGANGSRRTGSVAGFVGATAGFTGGNGAAAVMICGANGESLGVGAGDVSAGAAGAADVSAGAAGAADVSAGVVGGAGGA
jgi:hypothetical protein